MSSPAPGRPLGTAVVGGGFMAGVHTRAARSARSRLVGALTSTPEGSRRAAAEHGLERGYADLDELLADDAVDVVHVCTPNARHAEQALAAVRAGKHVVCEKPLATGAADAAEVVAAAREAGVVVAVPFVYRFHPMVREARARVRSGAVGRVLTVTGSYLQDWMLSPEDDDWRVDPAVGGPSRAFADIGSHLVDLLETVTGDHVVRLVATTSTVHADRAQHTDVRTEDAAAVVVATAGGAIGTLLVSQVAPGRKNRLHLEVAGSTESLAFDQEHPETLWVGRRAGSLLLPRDADQLSPDAARLCAVPAGHPQGYQDAFDAFVADVHAAVRGEAPEALPLAVDGARAVDVTAAVLASTASGGWVDAPAPA
ncbi:Gfo/Idh/MocA family oxidoreductase [Pseudokineococcus basanitobsidens]|uniref:Gfo/Idh/MocA family oxidoreductase n=1 Tax=Pseudokineococcus basanitobsidens TaxID=1926649 RepID=A0ABU8RHJ0_9ACTN